MNLFMAWHVLHTTDLKLVDVSDLCKGVDGLRLINQLLVILFSDLS